MTTESCDVLGENQNSRTCTKYRIIQISYDVDQFLQLNRLQCIIHVFLLKILTRFFINLIKCLIFCC